MTDLLPSFALYAYACARDEAHVWTDTAPRRGTCPFCGAAGRRTGLA